MPAPNPVTGRCPRCAQSRPLFETPAEWGNANPLLCSPCWQAEAVDVDQPGWDARCYTCDATATEEWEEEGELDRADVARWQLDHRCDPDVHLIAPQKTVVNA